MVTRTNHRAHVVPFKEHYTELYRSTQLRRRFGRNYPFGISSVDYGRLAWGTVRPQTPTGTIHYSTKDYQISSAAMFRYVVI
jgi:hypothetical protein